MKGFFSRINRRTAIYGMIFLLVLDVSYVTFMVDAFADKGYTYDYKLLGTLLMFPLAGFSGALLLNIIQVNQCRINFM